MLALAKFFITDTEYQINASKQHGVLSTRTMDDKLAVLTQLVVDFRDARDWAQFHDPRNLALALSLEASELNELFLWRKGAGIDGIDPQRLREELADVFAYAFLLAERLDLDVEEIVREKIRKNEEKYPVEKAKGSSVKYDKL